MSKEKCARQKSAHLLGPVTTLACSGQVRPGRQGSDTYVAESSTAKSSAVRILSRGEG